MNLQQLRTQTRIYLDDRQADRWSNVEIHSLINAAKDEIQKIIDEADEGFFSGCQNYAVERCETSFEFALPTDFKKVILAERLQASGDPIPAVWTQFQRRHYETGSMAGYTILSQPVCYLRGTNLGVVEPQDAYTLRVWYTKRLPDMAGDSDTTEIPPEYHNLIALYSARLGLGAEASSLPEQLEKEFAEEMGRLSIHIETRQKQDPRSVIYIEED